MDASPVRVAGTRRWLVRLTLALVAVAVLVTLAVLLVPDAEDAELLADVPTGTAGGPGVEGCLGGPVQDNAMLLAAQDQAPADAAGAAAFAGSLLRWLGSEPGPDQVDDLVATIDRLVAQDATERVHRDLEVAVQYAREDASGDDWTLTTAGGGYYIESEAAGAVTLSVLGERFFDDGRRQVLPMTFDLVHSEVGWTVRDWGASARTGEDLRAVMTTFSGGC